VPPATYCILLLEVARVGFAAILPVEKIAGVSVATTVLQYEINLGFQIQNPGPITQYYYSVLL
jgi:hypothetical protein